MNDRASTGAGAAPAPDMLIRQVDEIAATLATDEGKTLARWLAPLFVDKAGAFDDEAFSVWCNRILDVEGAASSPAVGLDPERLFAAIEREKRGSIRYPEDIGHDMGMAHAQDIIRREARLRDGSGTSDTEPSE